MLHVGWCGIGDAMCGMRGVGLQTGIEKSKGMCEGDISRGG